MDTSSPCKSIFEAEYAEMVEHVAMVLYSRGKGAKLLVSVNDSPGMNRLNTSPGKKGTANLAKCPGVDLAAKVDAATLLKALATKAPGSGK